MRSSLRKALAWAMAGAILALPAVSQADDKPGGEPAPGGMDAESMAQMQAWQQFAAPGEHHKHLEPFIGTWDVTVKMWMAPGEPATSTGVGKSEWMLGGRFVHTTFHGDFMGMPFEGAGLTGYDNLQKKYTSIWVDNMGTYMSVMDGQDSADGKTFTYTGMMPDPMGGPMHKVKEVLRVVSNDEHVMEWWEPGEDGKDTKTMEIVYKRKKTM